MKSRIFLMLVAATTLSATALEVGQQVIAKCGKQFYKEGVIQRKTSDGYYVVNFSDEADRKLCNGLAFQEDTISTAFATNHVAPISPVERMRMPWHLKSYYSIGSSIAYECQDFDSGFQRLIVEAVIEAISSNGYVKVKLARGGVHSDCSQTEGWLKVSEWFE